MALTEWNLRTENPKGALHIQQKYHLNPLISNVLSARGVSDPELESLFRAGTPEDPFLIKDMDRAVKRIQEAVASEETIAVYGDYDCDGVCAAAILVSYLETLGAQVLAYIPERDEGYGLSKKGIDSLKEQGVSLVVTVDSGISALPEADYLYSCGMELVVTDHHEVGRTLPRAEAVVDPHRPDSENTFCDLCGAGVALKLVAALEGGNYDTVFEFAGDLAAIATIADIMPLVGENRIIVETGLHFLELTENPGLCALIQAANLKQPLSALNVSFGLCPRINAAGRLGQAKLAYALLTEEDPEKAQELAQTLCELNQKRQEQSQKLLEKVQRLLVRHKEWTYDHVIVAAGKNWPHGVLGIVSGRICEQYGKPVILLTIEGDEARGSARSIPGFSIYQAMDSCHELFSKWGGHELAGGMTLPAKDVPALRRHINAYAAKVRHIHPKTEIDAILNPLDLTLENIQGLQKLGPFGAGNPQPVFLIAAARLDQVTPLSAGRHTKIRVLAGNRFITAVYFNMPRNRFYFQLGTYVHLLVTLGINHFRGTDQEDLHIIDLRPVDLKQKKMLRAKSEFEMVMRGECIPSTMLSLIRPTRKEFAAIYRLLARLKEFQGSAVDLYPLIFQSGINYCKLCIILEVLQENGLIRQTETAICAIENPPKTDLLQAKLMKRLSPDPA